MNSTWKSLAPFATLAGLIIVVWLDVRAEVRDVRTEIADVRSELIAEIIAIDRRLSEQIAAMDRRISNVTERVAHIEGLLEGARTKEGG